MAYRAPISSGWDAIGAALAGGVGRATDEVARLQREKEERERYEAEQARLKRAEETETKRYNLTHGIIDREQAFERIPGAPMRATATPTIERDATGKAIGGRVGDIQIAPGSAPVMQGVAAPERMREGVTEINGTFIDPHRSLGFVQTQATQQAELTLKRQEEDALAQEMMRANPQLSPEYARLRARGINQDEIMTPEQKREAAVADARAVGGVEQGFRREQHGWQVAAQREADERNFAQQKELTRLQASLGTGRGGRGRRVGDPEEGLSAEQNRAKQNAAQAGRNMIRGMIQRGEVSGANIYEQLRRNTGITIDGRTLPIARFLSPGEIEGLISEVGGDMAETADAVGAPSIEMQYGAPTGLRIPNPPGAAVPAQRGQATASGRGVPAAAARPAQAARPSAQAVLAAEAQAMLNSNETEGFKREWFRRNNIPYPTQ